MAMNELAMKAWECPGIYWFISPIYAQAKDQYRKLVQFLPWEVIKKKSDSELRVELTSSGVIEYRSGEVLDRLRGSTLNGVVIDEVRDQHKELWPMVIRPMLTTTQGWAAFISTPNGYDEFYDLFEMRNSDPNWESFHAPSTCNPMFPETELQAARETMSTDVFYQEILAEFREIGVGKTYKNHGVHNQVHENPFAVRGYDWSPYLPIVVGLDFNVGIMAWNLAQHKQGHLHYGDEIAVENTDTEQMALLLAEKVENHKPGVILIGDASGNARRTSAVGQTDYTIIKTILMSRGIKYEDLTPKENPGVKDRINSVNSMLKSADGTVKLTYNPVRCKYLKRDFERVKWKQGAEGAFLDKSDPLATHASDGAGYIVCHYNNVFRSRPGTMRIITR